MPNLFLNVFSPLHDNLFFTGLIQPDGGIWALADLQSRLIARYIKAHSEGNSVADWFREKIHSEANCPSDRKNYVDSPRHRIEVDYFEYRYRLRKLLEEFTRRTKRDST